MVCLTIFHFLCKCTMKKGKKRSDFSLFNIVSKSLKFFVALIFGEWTLGNNVLELQTEM